MAGSTLFPPIEGVVHPHLARMNKFELAQLLKKLVDLAVTAKSSIFWCLFFGNRLFVQRYPQLLCGLRSNRRYIMLKRLVRAETKKYRNTISGHNFENNCIWSRPMYVVHMHGMTLDAVVSGVVFLKLCS